MLENAKWICSSEDFVTVCPVFKKQINVKKAIERARLAITSVGMYECFIGGKRVGDFIFAQRQKSRRLHFCSRLDKL